MITFSGVSKKFGDKTVIWSLDINILKGEIVGFLGPNGAGKTTTMRLMLGYLRPAAGRIRIGGSDPESERLEVSRKAGYLPENNPLWVEMKVFEYLEFVARMKDVPPGEAVPAAVKSCGLAEVLTMPIEQLSRGYKQRVGMAAAIINDPEILILDEPTSGLDPVEQEKIRGMIRSYRRKKTVIISTHVLSEVEEMCSRVVIISRGRVVYDGSVPKKKGALSSIFKKKISA